jgi:hypothetical protein
LEKVAFYLIGYGGAYNGYNQLQQFDSYSA